MIKQQLYQVRVLSYDDKKGSRSIDIGPKMIKEATEMFCNAVAANIKNGKIHGWSDPIVYPVYE